MAQFPTKPMFGDIPAPSFMEHKTYTKIQSLYKRRMYEPAGSAFKNLIIPGEYSLPAFEYLKDCQWDCFEKIDGSNHSVYWDGESVEVHGKTERANISDEVRQYLLALFPPAKLREAFRREVDESGAVVPVVFRIYGEMFGGRIQAAGPAYRSSGEVDFRVFDVSVNGCYLSTEEVKRLCEVLGCRMAPYIGRMSLVMAEELVRKGMESSEAPGKEAEGMVCRPAVRLYDEKGGRVIVKLKTSDYRKLEAAEKAVRKAKANDSGQTPRCHEA